MAKRSAKKSVEKSSRKSTAKKSGNKKSTPKNSLVANINKRKRSHTSRSKKDSTVSPEAYEQMKEGWPKKKRAKKSAKKKSASARSTTKKTGTKKKGSKSKATKKAKRASATKDPHGGLTAAGRREFNEKDGSHLRPGVKGPADTPDKMRRKGSFLRRHYATLRGPLVDDQGQPTRLALQAHAWGEPVPKSTAAAKKLAAKGSRLLERYRRTKASKQT